MLHQEFLPHPTLRPYIHLYGNLINAPIQGQTLEDLFPPSLGNGIIILLSGKEHIIWQNAINDHGIPDNYILTQEDRAQKIALQGPMEMFSVIFRPGAFFHFRQLPLSHHVNELLSISDIQDRRLEEYCERIRAARSQTERLLISDQFFLSEFARREPDSRLSEYALKQMLQDPQLPLHQLARNLPVSERQFRRIFEREIGISPKKYQQKIRITQAMHLLSSQPQVDLLEVAIRCGFYDISHLNRAFNQSLFVTANTFHQQAFPISKAIYYREEVENHEIIL